MATAKKKQKARFSNDVRIENRKARHDYHILEKVEAGIELTGNEVKSLRQGSANLTDTYALARGEELILRGMHIKPYEEGNTEANPQRDRRLLLHKKEIGRLIGSVSQKGLTLVPLRVYFNAQGWAKAEIGLCQGKKTHDKRETIRKRDQERELRREFKIR